MYSGTLASLRQWCGSHLVVGYNKHNILPQKCPFSCHLCSPLDFLPFLSSLMMYLKHSSSWFIFKLGIHLDLVPSQGFKPSLQESLRACGQIWLISLGHKIEGKASIICSLLDPWSQWRALEECVRLLMSESPFRKGTVNHFKKLGTWSALCSLSIPFSGPFHAPNVIMYKSP